MTYTDNAAANAEKRKMSKLAASGGITMKKMSRWLCVLAIFLLATGMATADGQPVHAEPGSMFALAGIEYGWGGFGVSGGVEFMLKKFDIPNFPLTLGAMGLAGIEFGSGVGIAMAGMATLHWGLKSYAELPEYFQKFDWYIGLGLGMGIVPFGIGISSGGGVDYYLKENLAIGVRSFYVYHFSGGSGANASLGVRLKL